MAVIKYLPAEIDGVEITQKIERLLQDIDVFVDVTGLSADNLRDALGELVEAIDDLQVGEVDFNLLLTEPFTWTILLNQDGNALSKGF